MRNPVFFVMSFGVLVACSEQQSADLLATTNQVIETTKATCSFAPTVASIAAILGVPGAPAAATLATQICTEVNTLPSLESGEGARSVSVTVDGHVVEGLRY